MVSRTGPHVYNIGTAAHTVFQTAYTLQTCPLDTRHHATTTTRVRRDLFLQNWVQDMVLDLNRTIKTPWEYRLPQQQPENRRESPLLHPGWAAPGRGPP